MQSSEPSGDRLEAIARTIESDSSPVGIDAKKTHVLIIHALEQIQERLDRMEDRLATLSREGARHPTPGDDTDES